MRPADGQRDRKANRQEDRESRTGTRKGILDTTLSEHLLHKAVQFWSSMNCHLICRGTIGATVFGSNCLCCIATAAQ